MYCAQEIIKDLGSLFVRMKIPHMKFHTSGTNFIATFCGFQMCLLGQVRSLQKRLIAKTEEVVVKAKRIIATFIP